MLKAIIFDLDNTLIDFMKLKHISIEAAASAMIDAGLKQNMEKIIKRLFQLYDIYGYEDQTIFQKYLKETINKIDFRILAHGINAYRKARSGFLEPFPHVLETLINLKYKGLKLAIVSDAPRLKAWLRLTAMKIDSFFDAVVTFDDTKKTKPSRKPFEVALKQLKLPPTDCLMVGDMPQRDIAGAQKLGMITCFARYGNSNKNHKIKADFEIDDIQEILNISLFSPKVL